MSTGRRHEPNILWRTRVYLIGNMQYVTAEEGQTWREYVSDELVEMGVIVFNPYHKPFIKDVQEGPEVRKKLKQARINQDYDFLSQKMKEIRIYDLNLVDRSDFLIACINPNVASWGSAEEIVTGVRMKKPIFLAVVGGKQNCPDWIFGMFPHKYIYDSPEDIVTVLKSIDRGAKELDNERWKLLREDFR